MGRQSTIYKAPPRDVSEAKPKEGVNIIIWEMWPDDVLDALDFKLCYHLGRPPCRPAGPFGSRRINHKFSQKCAFYLALPSYCYDGQDRRMQYIKDVGKTWKRVRTAGIDMDTVEVVDEYRWSLAWFQFTRDFQPKYSVVEQNKMVRTGFQRPVPEKVCRFKYWNRDAYQRRKKAFPAEKNDYYLNQIYKREEVDTIIEEGKVGYLQLSDSDIINEDKRQVLDDNPYSLWNTLKRQKFDKITRS